jgi:hypothetical protein
VTEDDGGVRGLLRGQGQTVLFWSSHSFGFFSASQVEVTTPPCNGWTSPIFDVAADPLSSYSRVIIGLSDGDVLVFQTVTGKNKEKTCDLTFKFPRVSPIPFQLHVVRGHVMGLPSPLEETKRPSEYSRELFFFNLAAIEGGFGDTESRSVTLQASFGHRRVDSYALLSQSGGSGSGGSGGAKMHLTLRFADNPSSLELYDLQLKTPPAAGAGGGSGGSGSGGGSGTDFASWLDWIPKVGVFGIALIGVVFWNVRKVAAKKNSNASSHNFDSANDELIRQLQEKRKNSGKAKGKIDTDSLDDKIGSLLEKTKDLPRDIGDLNFGDLRGDMEDD